MWCNEYALLNQFPQYWVHVPLIYLKKGNDSIRNLLGIDKEAKYASMINFFDAQGNYKIEKQIEEAYKESIPNQFQKDFIEVDKKVNLLNSALSGNILKVFPIPAASLAANPNLTQNAGY